MIKLIRYLFAICVIYIYIYNPVLSSGFDPMIILYPFLIYLIGNLDKKHISYLKDIIIPWFSVFLFIIFRTFVGSEPGYLFNWVGSLIEIVLLSYALALFLFREKVNINECLIYMGAVASIITCLCLFIPSINDTVRGMQMVYSEAYERNLFRGFGFAQGLNFEYSFIQAFVFSLILYNYRNNKLFLFFIPFLLLSILVNARSGILAIFIAMGIYFMSDKKRILRNTITVIIIIFIVYFTYNKLYQYIPETTALFIDEFFLQLKDALFGTSDAQYNTVEELTTNMIIFPKSMDGWICGYGKSLFGSGSDVGYIIQLYYGGIIYLILLYIFDFSLIKKGFAFIPLGLVIILILSLLLANLKGGILGGNNGAIRFVALLASSHYLTYSKSVIKK